MEYIVEPSGDIVTKLNGKLHSFDDKPAIINIYGDKYWYENGLLHRDANDLSSANSSLFALPAIIYNNGDEYYYRHGKLHSYNDIPAISTKKLLAWYKDGVKHRDKTKDESSELPAEIETTSENIVITKYYWNGMLHRDVEEDPARTPPAVISSNGDQIWYKYGKRHRDGGLFALEYGNSTRVWYENDVLIKFEHAESATQI